MRFPWQRKQDEVARLAQIVSEQAQQVAAQGQKIEQATETIERTTAVVSGLYEFAKQVPTNPEAHRFDNPWRYASPHSTKRHPESLAPLETLRQFAKNYDVLRSCINHLKREVQSIPFTIVSRDPKKSNEDRIADAMVFFSRNGGLGGVGKRPRHFENEIFEDVLVVGAYAVYINPTLGGTPYEVVAIDAATIRPKVNLLGWQDPDDAYEQQIMGVPIRSFGMKELMYDGLDSTTDSPYFRSPVEYLLSVIMSALKADEWNRTWLTDGNVPDAFFQTPPDWTPDQVERYAGYLDSLLVGNIAERRKAKVVPSGVTMASTQTRKDSDFQEFERWLMTRTCSIMGVQPASIGYAGEQYKVSQETSMKFTTAYGVGALLQLRKEGFDDLLEMLGYGDLEVKNVPAGEEDPDKKSARIMNEVGGPIRTVNEGRAEIGLDPIEGGDVIPGLGEEEEDPFADDDDSDDDDDDDEAEDTEARIEDLAKWERKALNRLKEGKQAACEFRSDHITKAEYLLVLELLRGCETTSDVSLVFRGHQDQLRGPDGRWISMGPVKDFIKESLDNRNFIRQLRVTSIGKSTGKILKELTGVDFTGFGVWLSASDIRHSMNGHGPESEAAKNGAIPIDENSFSKAIQALTHPERANVELPRVPGGPAMLTVHRRDKDGNLTTIQVIRNPGHPRRAQHRALTLKTVYKNK